MSGLAMIPCAGFGLRMRPLTSGLPKPLLSVHGVPLLAYSLFLLHEWQIEHCIINLHYRGDQIKEYLKDFPFFSIHFSEEKDRILGTAGGIRYAMETTPLRGRFLYMNPDTIFWPDHRPEAPAESSDLFLYLCKKEPGNTERSFEPIFDEDHRLEQQFVPIRMGRGPFYYSGLSLLHTDTFCGLKAGEVAELRDIFARYSDVASSENLNQTFSSANDGELCKTNEGAGSLFGRLYRGWRYDCGTLEQFEALKKIDPVPAAWKDRWQSFLSRWPEARLNEKKI